MHNFVYLVKQHEPLAKHEKKTYVVLRVCLQSKKVKVKSKRSIAVRDSPHRYGNSHAIWDHTVLTCHPAEVTFPPLPQPKLVLD